MAKTRSMNNYYERQVWQRWYSCKIDPVHTAQITLTSQSILKNAPAYQEVSNATGVPFWFIGCLHFREASFLFDRHLLNGDPLTGRTIHVPIGRPTIHDPPFTWFEGATDAIDYMKLNQVIGWDLVKALILAEQYNGIGYKNKGVASPYVWAGTDQYKGGLYTKDGVFDKTVMDERIGVAPILMALRASGVDLNELEPI